MESDRGRYLNAPLPMARPPLEAIHRLLAKVVEDKGCWLWCGNVDAKGYGKIKVHQKPQWIHRVAYAAFVSPIPEGMTVHHKCATPNCCNPEHLELMTLSENTTERNDRHNGEQLEDAPF